MHHMKRVTGFSPSRSREAVQKIIYETKDRQQIKLHVSRPDKEPTERLSDAQVFILSASLLGVDGKLKSVDGKGLISKDHHLNMQLSDAASQEDMKPYLFKEKPKRILEKDGYLWADDRGKKTCVKRYGDGEWHPWFEIPSGASDMAVFVADQLEGGLRSIARKMVDDGAKIDAFKDIVPGL